ncbi:MAG: YegS/Rv2252/BmrU family lipid kinase [Bacilli bacterium]|nr:YegS/Rv2252/BmrU family lipid kinase [Bacilli bacterium]
MKKCIVIYNPNSGHTLKKRLIPRYKSIIEKHDYKVNFIATQYRGHAKEIVQHIGYVDLVISMGGDGTFNEIVYGNTLRHNPLLLAHIPIGTTNDIGRMFGYTNDIEKNLEICLKGEVKNIDIPALNKRPFIYVAGFGKFLNIAYDTTREDKKKFGYFAYIYNAFKDLFGETKMHEITYKENGEEHTISCSMMMICSATRVAGFNSFFKDVKLDDDQFEVYIVTASKRLRIIRALGLSAIKGTKNIDDVISFRTNNLSIKFKKRLTKNWCVDGEKLEIRSLNYDISNIHSISMLVPKKNISKLFIK